MSFHFEKIKDPPRPLQEASVFEVYWQREFVGYIWEILGRWNADYSLTFHYGQKPTVQGFDKIAVAEALRDGLRGE